MLPSMVPISTSVYPSTSPTSFHIWYISPAPRPLTIILGWATITLRSTYTGDCTPLLSVKCPNFTPPTSYKARTSRFFSSRPAM